MTIEECAKAGISRFRDSRWANPNAYMRMDLFPGGTRGPWFHLFDRESQEVCNLPTPQDVLCTVVSTDAEVEPYDGPLDPADTYHYKPEDDAA